MKFRAAKNGDHPEDGYAIFDELNNCVILTALDGASFDEHQRLAEFTVKALNDADFDY